MKCYFLQCLGKKAKGIDITSRNFSNKAINKGVILLEMDVADLKFEVESYDFIFSYNSFERLLEPELVLKEAIHVVKKKGNIFLFFGPLYMSPWGLHTYRTITIPYCQFLFQKHMLKNFSRRVKGLKPLGDSQLNKWSVEDFRKLWEKCSNRLKKVKYYEISDISHLNLFMQYTQCFRSKTTNFDDLIASHLIILFKKI